MKSHIEKMLEIYRLIPGLISAILANPSLLESNRVGGRLTPGFSDV